MTYQYEYYLCPACKERLQTKTCPSCKAKTKGQGNVSIRFRLAEDYKLKQKRTGWYATKKEAEAEYLKVKAAAPKVEYPTDNKQSYLFENLLAKYSVAKSLESGASTNYERQLITEKYLTAKFKGKDIRKITKQHLIDWQTWVFSQTYSRSKDGEKVRVSNDHGRKVRGILNSFLSWIEEYYDIPNLLSKIKMPPKPPKQTVTIKDILELSEYKLLHEVTSADIMWNTLFCFAFHTGMRPGELRAFSEADYYDGDVHINKTVSRKDRGIEYISPLPKNKKVYSKPIDDTLKSQLKNYLEWKRDNGISDKFLFGGDEFIGKHKLERTLKGYLEKLQDKITKHITPHCFRHSYVSMLIDMDCSTKTVAEMIGDTEEVVMQTYSHLYTTKKRQTIDRLNEYLSARKTENVPKTFLNT